MLVDVRRYPGSRRHPHFARDALAEKLPRIGIAYEWWGAALGAGRWRTSPATVTCRGATIPSALTRATWKPSLSHCSRGSRRAGPHNAHRSHVRGDTLVEMSSSLDRRRSGCRRAPSHPSGARERTATPLEQSMPHRPGRPARVRRVSRSPIGLTPLGRSQSGRELGLTERVVKLPHARRRRMVAEWWTHV